MATVLVPEYLGSQVRAGIRALARKGDICDLAWGSYGAKSTYVHEFIRITSSEVDDNAYIDDVIGLCRQKRYDFILPFGNASCYAVSKHSRRLEAEGVRFMAPDFETFRIAHDKAKTLELCRSLGIETPWSFVGLSGGDLDSMAKDLRYPVVIKARSGVGVSTGLRYANNREELLKFHHELSSFKARTGAFDFTLPLIQEFVPGFIHDACTLTDRGRVFAVLTQRRHIMYPIYGGVGAVNVTTHNKTVRDYATRILEALRWHGPAQIEFKFDERDRKYKLIEINPKLWGTLDLSIKAGVDFPGMIRDTLLGCEVQRHPLYEEGLRYKFWFPQATIAYRQILKEFGMKATLDPFRYKRTFTDIDLKDLKFDLARMYGAVRLVMRGGHASPHANLPRGLINRVAFRASNGN